MGGCLCLLTAAVRCRDDDGSGGCGGGSGSRRGHDGIDGRDLDGHGVGSAVQLDEHCDEDCQCEHEDESRRREEQDPPIEAGGAGAYKDEVGDILRGVGDGVAADGIVGACLHEGELAVLGDA